MDITQASMRILNNIKQTGGLIEFSNGSVAPKQSPESTNLGESIQLLIQALWEQEHIDFEMPVEVVEQTSNQHFYGIYTLDSGPGLSSLIIENSQGETVEEFDHRWFDVSTKEKIEQSFRYYYNQGLIHESDFNGLDEYMSELVSKANT